MMGEGWDSLQLKAAFDAAGYSTDAEGLYRHFLDYGNAEGVSPSSWFDSSEYLYNKAADYYGRTNITGQNANSMLVAMNLAGMSPYEHFHQYWAESFASKGIFHNPSQSFDTAAYMNAKLAEMQKGDPAYTMEMLVKDFQDIGLDPIQHYEMYGKAEGLSVNAAPSATPISSPPATTKFRAPQATTTSTPKSEPLTTVTTSTVRPATTPCTPTSKAAGRTTSFRLKSKMWKPFSSAFSRLPAARAAI